jgi:transposase
VGDSDSTDPVGTGLVDLERGRLLDLVADRTRRAVDGWLGARPAAWLAQVGTVALDPWRGYASALVAPLGHATVVVDHFHAIRLANVVVARSAVACSRRPLATGPQA